MGQEVLLEVLSSTLALSNDRQTANPSGLRHFLIISTSRFASTSDKYYAYRPPSSRNGDWSKPNGQSRAKDGNHNRARLSSAQPQKSKSLPPERRRTIPSFYGNTGSSLQQDSPCGGIHHVGATPRSLAVGREHVVSPSPSSSPFWQCPTLIDILLLSEKPLGDGRLTSLRW
jgi:hypothetical protein